MVEKVSTYVSFKGFVTLKLHKPTKVYFNRYCLLRVIWNRGTVIVSLFRIRIRHLSLDFEVFLIIIELHISIR